MGNARLIRFWFVLHSIKFYPISSKALKIVVASNLFSTFIPDESILLWQEFEYNENVQGHVRRYIRTYSPSAYKLYKLHEYYELYVLHVYEWQELHVVHVSCQNMWPVILGDENIWGSYILYSNLKIQNDWL